jgi:MoxR-like ATPase
MRLLLEGRTDRTRDIQPVLDPRRLAALQQEVFRVQLDSALASYLYAIISATRGSPLLALGASTRAAISLAHAARARALLRRRSYCLADDIRDLAIPVLAHRVRLAAHADGFLPTREESESVIHDIVGRVPVPL